MPWLWYLKNYDSYKYLASFDLHEFFNDEELRRIAVKWFRRIVLRNNEALVSSMNDVIGMKEFYFPRQNLIIGLDPCLSKCKANIYHAL